MDGRQISPRDLTIVSWIANKSTKLIKHAKHEWLMKWPRDYQIWTNKKKCLSILGLVHACGNLVSWFSALQVLYLHFPCTLDGGETTNHLLRNARPQK